jgi:hypothetical protein
MTEAIGGCLLAQPNDVWYDDGVSGGCGSRAGRNGEPDAQQCQRTKSTCQHELLSPEPTVASRLGAGRAGRAIGPPIARASQC